MKDSFLTKASFDNEWVPTGEVVAGRPVKCDPRHPKGWGEGVWWSDEFGVCSPIVASIGGPLGYERVN